MAFGMELKDWIMTAAVIAGPILAVQSQKIIESFLSKKQRRLNLFHTLMSTRATRLSPTWFVELPLSIASAIVGTLAGIKWGIKNATAT